MRSFIENHTNTKGVLVASMNVSYICLVTT